jgi:superfamily II DNA or RNA helicase
MASTVTELSYAAGQIEVRGPGVSLDRVYSQCGASGYRLAAHHYRSVVLDLRDAGLVYKDHAAAYQRLPLGLAKALLPRKHQSAALDAWNHNQKLGIVCLPTGAGKTILAVMAIVAAGRSTLVVVPTLELLRQWHSVLSDYLGCEVGLLGGGSHAVLNVTVATYDSAAIYVSEFGDRFGLLVCDECHHLPTPSYRIIAESMIAPFRLGLSATPERNDGGQELMEQLLGGLIYRAEVAALSRDEVLSPFSTEVIKVELTADERRRYEDARQCYQDFLKRYQLNMGAGFQAFLGRAMRLPGGKAAIAAFRLQRSIYQNPAAKISVLYRLIRTHVDDRMIVFTDDNHQAYQLGRLLLVPVISHHSNDAERKLILTAFACGELKVIVTSKVLNEGVDVPEANVAVIYSGSSAVREHVQRLGRILRHRPDKTAVLYELVSADTREQSVHKQRRRHHAYRSDHS